MTAGPTSPSTLDAPLPPANFGRAQLPVFELNLAATNLYRVHRRSYGPIFYNRRSSSSTTFRFDAPNDEYGVLYASPSFDACLAETLLQHPQLASFLDRYDIGIAVSDGTRWRT
ncbi:MAG: RES domain-containing protein [Paraburkholderia sp.]|uniref:RES domain-containing protein n=1 Tax=Paraburkholderia sp. TaxID=1926495 RepID=UPI00120DD80D|nr:RES domain-containing protein [Paraburkholderia sp.]TAM03126.1 MAG: RES domain-containing protein [Paraburkholderia sp.]TAM27668.1 MAG: RES domain-containing protein [Paraburkholderia sp.]